MPVCCSCWRAVNTAKQCHALYIPVYCSPVGKKPASLLPFFVSPFSVLENITFYSLRLQRELHLRNPAVIVTHVCANVTGAVPGGAAGAAGPGGGAPGTAVARLHRSRRVDARRPLGSPGPRPRGGRAALRWGSGLETATGPSAAERVLTPCYRPGGNSASHCEWGGALCSWRQVMLLQLPECGRSGRDGQGSWSCRDAVWGRWIRHFYIGRSSIMFGDQSIGWQLFFFFSFFVWMQTRLRFQWVVFM